MRETKEQTPQAEAGATKTHTMPLFCIRLQ